MLQEQSIGVVIPARNEALSIQKVIGELRALRTDKGPLINIIVVCDNGSDDLTAELARQAGSQVVYEPRPGYGRACLCALAALEETDIILFIDADDAFNPQQALNLVHLIQEGADLVIGSRSMGHCVPGAMTRLQVIGNGIACFLIRILFNVIITDLGPYRAIKTTALKALDMQSKTYGWTVEMQVKAIQSGLKMAECPVDTKTRTGTSKISGTLLGSLGAAFGICSTIIFLWLKNTSATLRKT